LTLENQNEKVYLRTMLTKQDLIQLGKVVREEIVAEARNIREELQAEIKFARMESINEINRLGDRIKNLDVRLSQFQRDSEKGLKRIESNISRLRKDLNAFTMSFDRDRANLQKRIMILESHAGIANQ